MKSLFYLAMILSMALACKPTSKSYKRKQIPGVNAPKDGTPQQEKDKTPETDQGGNNNDNDNSSNNDTGGGVAALSFATDISPILKESCAVAGCHLQSANVASVEVETYDGAKKHFERSMVRIKAGTMPPPGGYPQVSEEKQKKLADWQVAGFPQ